MKRPQGFDPRPSSDGKAPEARPAPATGSTTKGTPAVRRPKSPGRAPAPLPHPSTARGSESEARKQLHRAKLERRKFERGEVRRFTRRSRRRKVGWLTAGGIVVGMAGLLAFAVYSPLLALREIRIEGTSRIPAEQLSAALDEQLGTPLPLLDLAEVKTELSEFPLIESYSTESRPPSTLVVRIVERTPVASVPAAGGFSLVDPAGVVIEVSAERPDGVPLLDIGGADTGTGRFDAASEVLVALPPDFLASVDTVTATTKDDVGLVLVDGTRVVWGSSDASAVKAERLPALIAANAGRDVTEYDVSSPDNLVVR